MSAKSALVAYVRKSIADGNDENMSLISRQIQGSDNKQKAKWLVALSHCCHLLPQELYDEILAVDPFSRKISDVRLVSAYCQYIEELVLAQPYYARRVVRSLVQYFRLSSSVELQEAAYSLLEHIISEVPQINIMQDVQTYQPHKSESLPVHKNFAQFLLRLLTYAPQLQETIFTQLMENLVQLDIEVTVDQDDMEDDEIRIVQQASSQFVRQDKSLLKEDSDSEDEDVVLFDESDNEVTNESRHEQLVRNGLMLKKVDCIMDVIIDHIDSVENRSILNLKPSKEIQGLFVTLMTCFDKIILRTHKSKYVQYIMFYICSLHGSFAEAYLSLLISRTFNTAYNSGSINSSDFVKISAASYLGSFLSRGKYVTAGMIADALTLCCEWIHGTLDNRHCNSAIWYAVVQVVMYVFCFRWRDLIYNTEVDSTMRWWYVRGGLERAFFSPLNPLKICSPLVVDQFNRIVKEQNMLQCTSSKLQSDNDSSYGTDESPPTPQVQFQIPINIQVAVDLHYPFDPTFEQLSCAQKFEAIYHQWQEGTV